VPDNIAIANIDFETYSECDIKSGAWKYAAHSSTEILCLAYCIDTEDIKLWTLGSKTPPIDLFEHLERGGLLSAFNAFFEIAIWNKVCVKKLKWPEIQLSQWRCSQAQALAYALPRSLENVALALKLSEKKDTVGRRIMLKLSKPRKPTKTNTSLRFTTQSNPEEFNKLYKYCKTDVLIERQISQKLKPLSKYEQRIWQLTQKINMYGVNVDVSLVNNALALIKETEKSLNSETLRITDGQVDTVSRRDLVLKYIQAQGIQMESYTRASIEETLKRDDIPKNVILLLKIRQTLGLTSTAKYKSLLAYLCDDSMIRGLLTYHGATTGRYASSGVQLQNLPRGQIKDQDRCIDLLSSRAFDQINKEFKNPFAVASSAIRGCLTARPGYILIAADYAAIEARVLLWLAGDNKALDLFRQNKDIYIDMASDIYKVSPDQVTKEQRQLGKVAILGLGYGMGIAKFKKTCDSWGIEITEELATQTVRSYRKKYHRVIEFWGFAENAAKQALLEKRKIINCGRVQFGAKDNFLFCRLPSARTLAYPFPKIADVETSWGACSAQITFEGVDTFTRKWERTSTYGGKLVENITQAVARDIMVEAMLQIDATDKYKILFTVHDEIVAETNCDNASVKEFEQLMCSLPNWASECPIKAEGWIGYRYKK